ncbi:SMI1/KNR4 family protein [Acinetobacter sichuanensis]|uniref:SMI1/KNR4 family protein n=1 Tax=Acinetobacter sichuanensis TaxID=2136183 RepID=UPI00280CD5A6|nr:SMI1/KNR4 family protein [Acinetobacter sichuanensis]MDQ9020307.1 SMI1/KNR4 family protein [Acinetobacter sichuanensis]
MIQEFLNIEEKYKVKFPTRYLQILTQFEYYCLYIKNAHDIDLYPIQKLFSKVKQEMCTYEYLQIWQSTQSDQFIKTFVFARSGDGTRLYFNLVDMSIWEYWLDEGSVRQLYKNFEDLMLNAELIDQE